MEAHNIQVPGQDQPVPEEELTVKESEVDTSSGKGKITTEEWRELMAFPSNDGVEKTLESTTKIQVEPVESKCREIPKQHRKTIVDITSSAI